MKKSNLNHLAVKKTSLSNGRLFTEVNHRVEASFDWLWCILILWTWSRSPSVVLRFNGVGGYFLKFQPILFIALGWSMTVILYSRYSATWSGFGWAKGKSQINLMLFFGNFPFWLHRTSAKTAFPVTKFWWFFPRASQELILMAQQLSWKRVRPFPEDQWHFYKMEHPLTLIEK